MKIIKINIFNDNKYRKYMIKYILYKLIRK